MTALLLLGSNIGDRKFYISEAKKLLASVGNVVSASSLYLSQSWGVAQEDYVNQVVELDTALAPDELLNALQTIEKKLGRTDKHKMKPRTIDLDILFVGQTVFQSETLTIPHPQMVYRKFTLVPLAEKWADFIHPVFGKTIQTLLDECADTSWVKKL